MCYTTQISKSGKIEQNRDFGQNSNIFFVLTAVTPVIGETRRHTPRFSDSTHLGALPAPAGLVLVCRTNLCANRGPVQHFCGTKAPVTHNAHANGKHPENLMFESFSALTILLRAAEYIQIPKSFQNPSKIEFR